MAATPVPSQDAQVKLLASDGQPGDEMGLGIAISGDTVLVSAYADDVFGTDSGSAYVYVRNGASWTEEAKLIPSDGAAGDNFGLRLSLSGDIAIVGSPLDDDDGSESGSAYIFVRSGTTWTQEAKLKAGTPAAGDQFGRWVFADGERVIVCCYLDDYDGFVDAGSAYIFRRDNGNWVQEAWLTPLAPESGARFARSVALHGTSAAVGSPLDDTLAGVDAGSAHAFVRVGTTWQRDGVFHAPDAAPSDQFGGAVGVFDNRIVVGAIKDDHSGKIDAGSAYVFRKESTPWGKKSQPGGLWSSPQRKTRWDFETKLVAFDAQTMDQFGRSVAMTSTVAIAGVIFDDHAAGTDAGSAYLFERLGTSWSPLSKYVPPDSASNDLLGYTVSIDGPLAAVGAFLDDNRRGVDAGCGYVFTVR